MPLSCWCEWDSGPGDIIWNYPDDYSTLQTNRRKRCCSCNELINIGDTVSRVRRWKVPEYDIEVDIYGEEGEIPRAPVYLCEECADIYFSLHELGFCIVACEDMHQLLKEYVIEFGSEPLK